MENGTFIDDKHADLYTHERWFILHSYAATLNNQRVITSFVFLGVAPDIPG
jgi:hypothetical protein